jgi:hypothetical protein
MTMATVIEILKAHLKAEGFGGLLADGAECGCELDDLAPCGGDFSRCEAGYKHMNPRNNGSNEWAIWRQKEPPTPEQWKNNELC